MKRKLKIDGTDQLILTELRQNCRRSYRELAAMLKISPATVIERMKRLEQERVITSYSANIDDSRLGYEFMAIASINISGNVRETQRKISKLSGITEVYDTSGEHNAVAIIKCKTRAEFSRLVKEITAIPEVHKTNTELILEKIRSL